MKQKTDPWRELNRNDLPVLVMDTNTEILVDEFILELKHKMYNNDLSVDDILFWAFFPDPCCVKIRRWGWYGWVEDMQHEDYAIMIDVPLGFLAISIEDFIRGEDKVTQAIDQRMFLELGPVKFKPGVIYDAITS